MNEEKFTEIMESEIKTKWTGCNVFSGLKIITKYLPDVGIEGAGHDIVYSASIDEIIEAGITEEDVTALRRMNWMIDENGEGLACFV